jgi:hypothetical protein
MDPAIVTDSNLLPVEEGGQIAQVEDSKLEIDDNQTLNLFS